MIEILAVILLVAWLLAWFGLLSASAAGAVMGVRDRDGFAAVIFSVLVFMCIGTILAIVISIQTGGR